LEHIYRLDSASASGVSTVQADLFAGAVFLQRAFNWNIYAAIVALLVVSAMFTIAGL